MSNILLIRAHDYPASELSWVVWNTPKQLATQQGKVNSADLSSLKTLNEGAITILAIPGEHVRAFNVSLPGKKRTLLSSLPFMIEEHISEPIEKMHVVSGQFKDNQIEAFAINHDNIRYWQTLAFESGLDIRYITPDYQLLATQEPTTLWQEGTRVMARLHQLQATFSEQTLNLLLPKLQLANHCTLYTDSSVQFDSLTAKPLPRPLTEVLAANFSLKAPPVNLLQGDYQAQSALHTFWPLLKKPVIAAACLIGLLFTGVILDNMKLSRQIADIDQALIDTYRQSFPNARRINDPVRQMRAQLRQQNNQGDSSQFLSWLAAASPLLSTHNIRLQNLRFSPSPAALRLQLQANSYNAMEKLNSDLQAAGLNTELGTLVKNQDSVSGLLTLKGQ